MVARRNQLSVMTVWVSRVSLSIGLVENCIGWTVTRNTWMSLNLMARTERLC